MAVMLPSNSRRTRSAGPVLTWGLTACAVGALVWIFWPKGGTESDAVPLSGQAAPGGKAKARQNPDPQERKRKKPAPAPAPRKASFVSQAEELVRRAERKGDEHALRALVGKLVLDQRLDPSYRQVLLARADELNARQVFSSTRAPGFTEIRVGPGDSYWKLCRRLRKEKGIKVSSGLLQAINQVAPNRLRVGTVLKVPTGKLSLLVDKSDFSLYVLLDGVYIMRYLVGIGRDGLTPEGRFVIVGKTAKPTWTDPKTGRVFKYGEAGHIIGSHWMRFSRDGRETSFGIHGTVEPDSIGQAASDGCIRMLNDQVGQLFQMVPEGTEVLIRS